MAFKDIEATFILEFIIITNLFVETGKFEGKGPKIRTMNKFENPP